MLPLGVLRHVYTIVRREKSHREMLNDSGETPALLLELMWELQQKLQWFNFETRMEHQQ